MIRMLISVLAVAFMTGSVLAEDVSRYSIEKTADGYVRMDKQTGVMSICKEADGQLVCRLAADERDAYEGAITSLTKRVETVENRLAVLEAIPLKQPNALPSDEEFDKTLSMMERFFRHFMGVVKEFKDEEGTPGASPNKT